MSSLLNNLNEILTTKQEIKEIIQTESDLFSEYPAYIQQAIASGGASGYAYITTNGDHDIATYAMVNVQVPQEQVPYIPDGYTYVTGGKSITQNAEGIDIASYAYVDVAVPVPPEYIIPSGYAYITTNGDFDIRQFSAVNIEVPQSGSASGYAYITTNGDHDIAAYAMVNVEVPVPAGYIIPTGGKEILQNGTNIDISTYSYVDVAVPVPAGYIIPEGRIFISENGGDIDVSEFAYADVIVPVPAGYICPTGTYNIGLNGIYTLPEYAYAYVSVPASVIEVIPDGYTYVYGGKEILQNGTNIDISSYSYVDVVVPVPAGYIIPSGTYYATDNGTVDIKDYAYVDISVSGGGGITPSGTYYIGDNGTYDITEYEYVDVSVSGGSAVESYTWTNVPGSGNYRVAPSAEYYGLAFYVYKGSSSPWGGGQYTQILSDRQFAYTIPSSFTATRWTDYATNTYLLNSDGVQDYAYSCDPSNYNSLTNINNISQSSNEQEGKFELECHEMYGDINLTGSSNKLYPAGGDVHYFCNIKTINDEQGRTGYLTTGGGTLGNIPETSYFGNTVPYTYLNGRSWETIVEIYQNVIMLKDIVGPVANSEIYLNECDDVWANWMSGWNGGTTSYNSSTGNLEITFNSNYIVSGSGKNANIYQLEYRIENDGSNHMIGLSCENQATMDSTHLSGTTYISAGEIWVNGGQTGQMGTNFGYIDESELAQEGYTNYDVDFKLIIPRDMWLYGSTNFNTCWVEWTLTPDSSAIADSVTSLKMNIGTNSWASDTSGSQTQDGWEVSSTKSNKSASDLNNYRIWTIKVGSLINGTTQWLPDIQSPISVTTAHTEQTVTLKADDGDAQIFNVDSTIFDSTYSGTFKIKIYDDFFDSSSQNYHKAVLSLDIA